MATREQAHKLLDKLPESEIDPVVEFIVSRGENRTGTEEAKRALRAVQGNGPEQPAGDRPPDPGAPADERWAYFARHAAPPTDDDTPVLAGTGGRPATRNELLAFVAAARSRRAD